MVNKLLGPMKSLIFWSRYIPIVHKVFDQLCTDFTNDISDSYSIGLPTPLIFTVPTFLYLPLTATCWPYGWLQLASLFSFLDLFFPYLPLATPYIYDFKDNKRMTEKLLEPRVAWLNMLHLKPRIQKLLILTFP